MESWSLISLHPIWFGKCPAGRRCAKLVGAEWGVWGDGGGGGCVEEPTFSTLSTHHSSFLKAQGQALHLAPGLGKKGKGNISSLPTLSQLLFTHILLLYFSVIQLRLLELDTMQWSSLTTKPLNLKYKCWHYLSAQPHFSGCTFTKSSRLQQAWFRREPLKLHKTKVFHGCQRNRGQDAMRRCTRARSSPKFLVIFSWTPPPRPSSSLMRL